MSLDQRSLDKLQGVRPELVNVIKAAAERSKFRVTEGLRSKERQATLVKARKSKTMNSRHITGHAIDFIAIGADGIATYDMDDMARVVSVIKDCAAEQGVMIECGFDWGWDAPHIELDRKAYPAQAVPTRTIIAEEVSKPPAVAATGAAVGAGAVSAGSVLPAVPPPPDLSWLSQWQGFGDAVSSGFSWVSSNPIIAAACAAWLGMTWFAPAILEAAKRRLAAWQS